MAEASRELGLDMKSISAVCRGVQKVSKGFKFTYI